LGELDIVAVMSFYRPAYKSRGINDALVTLVPIHTPTSPASASRNLVDFEVTLKSLGPLDRFLGEQEEGPRVALHTPSAKVDRKYCLEPRGLPSRAQNRRTAEQRQRAGHRGESRDAPTSLRGIAVKDPTYAAWLQRRPTWCNT
jgi:hypothetical protein